MAAERRELRGALDDTSAQLEIYLVLRACRLRLRLRPGSGSGPGLRLHAFCGPLGWVGAPWVALGCM
eukprot:COSAG04_NODE_2848_length_3489_cov_2.165487_2_plen_67_part_00